MGRAAHRQRALARTPGDRRAPGQRGPEDRLDIERDVLSAGYRSSAALGVLVLLASPVITLLLHLDSWLIPALVAAAAVPLTVMGVQAAYLQGDAPLGSPGRDRPRRWGSGGRLRRPRPARRAQHPRRDGRGRRRRPGAGGHRRGRAAPPRRQCPVRGATRANPTGGPRAASCARWGRTRTRCWPSRALHVDAVTTRITLDEHQAGLDAGGLDPAKAVSVPAGVLDRGRRVPRPWRRGSPGPPPVPQQPAARAGH